MIGDLGPYAGMKNSGVEWLGAVPAHWNMRRLKALLIERGQKGFPDEPLLTATQSKGVVRKDQYENRTVLAMKDLHLLKLVCVGDFVISLRSFQGGIEFARERGIISPAYTVLYPKQPQAHGYLAWLFKSTPFIQGLSLFVTGIRQGQNIDYEKLSRSRVPLPPLDEQAAIVRFLDHADRRIRRAIAAKQKLIRLLVEQKRVVIYRAVTRGFDSDVSLKSSGIEWIGDVPEHWAVYRIKQVSQILRGKFTHRPRNDPSLYDGPYPFIQTGEVARSGKTIKAYRQTLNERGLAVSKMFPKGTLVMTIAANIGEVAILDFEACFPDSVVGFVPRDHMDRDYLYYIFSAMKPELLREAPVNTQGNLNVERIGCRGVALPPVDEQQRNVVLIEKRIMEADAAIERSACEISLLREFRSRLAADVVTGKLDVRAAAAQLPESTELDDGEFDAVDEIDDGEESIDEAAVEDQAA